MRRSDFTSKAWGHLVRAGLGAAAYEAFVPSSLPPQLDWTLEDASVLSAADRAIGRLAGVGQTLPNPHLLIGPFMRREAVLSSRIEGTQASLDDLLLFEADASGERKGSDVREVWNYIQALEYGLVRQKAIPLSKRLIRELHLKLLDGVRGQERTPGEFRRTQNWIGPPGCDIRDATFVPPPPEQMETALDELEQFLHAQSSLPPLVRLALIHYQFEAIHPFADGNGRIGRLLITLILCLDGTLPGPLLYLSAYFERHRESYYRTLLRVSQNGEWTEWIRFILRGIANESMDAVNRANRLLSLRDAYRNQALSASSGSRLPRLVDHLFQSPALTVAQAAKFLDLSIPAAQTNINKLVSAGILREVTGQRRNRVFVAHQIVAVVSDEKLDR